MLGFLRKSVDEKEIIEMKKKIAYIETDMAILKSQYQRLLDRYKIEAMTDARARKKEDDIDLQKISSIWYLGKMKKRIKTQYNEKIKK